MATIARKCVPFTPFERDLSKATVALVTSAGVHRKDQPGFNIADELGDLTFRILGGDVKPSDLMVTHHHYDHTDADADINVVFPIEPLRELAAEGAIGEIAELVGDIETRLVLTVNSGGSDKRYRRFRKIALKRRERDAFSCDACHELLSTTTARCLLEKRELL